MKHKPPRVLFATPEAAPVVKTGGLGDVAGALPAALRRLGLDVRMLLPGYPAVLESLEGLRRVAEIGAEGMLPGSRLLRGRVGEVPVYVLESAELYDRAGGPYAGPDGQDWPDNDRRFASFGRVAALLGREACPLRWRADVLHCNDWQTGLAPAYLHFAGDAHAASLITVHNLAFQGLFPSERLAGLRLPAASFDMHGLEFHGRISFLKAALYYANAISTVSTTYAREIQSEPLGFGLQGLLAARAGVLHGILNGIDSQTWNPSTDRALPLRYGPRSLIRKSASREALCRRMGIDRPGAGGALAGIVSRLTHQKGVDLVIDALPALRARGLSLAVLGRGDPELERSLTEASRRWPGAVAVQIGFEEPLAHLIEAGADLFLMPSRFEPCGLNQMYSQRYGTPPVVHATGGLADSVVDCTDETLADGTAGGFVFEAPNVPALVGAVERALELFGQPPRWRRLQRCAMAKDFGWERAARAYADLYRSLAPRVARSAARRPRSRP
ncbi:MAG: glycogen synthase GlgA [Burkholderiales bacterium]|nr:MAG: glycogen synthase GlgA [Burkholderiales bacterium]